MTNVVPGRDTAQIDEPFVVFLIGMRINKLTHLPVLATWDIKPNSKSDDAIVKGQEPYAKEPDVMTGEESGRCSPAC